MIKAITPYLSLGDRCEEALGFYAGALGGEIKAMTRVGEGPAEYHSPEHNNKIMHAELRVGDAAIMASDSMGHPSTSGSNTSLTLNFSSMEDIGRAWEKMKDGANVTMELQDMFWGARFGSLTDKFGINWMFNCDKKGS